MITGYKINNIVALFSKIFSGGQTNVVKANVVELNAVKRSILQTRTRRNYAVGAVVLHGAGG